MSYCFDTSALIEPWHRHYPIESFPSLWTEIENMIDKDQISCPDEVLVELEKKEDELYVWAKSKENLFYPIDDKIQTKVQEILKDFPRLVGTRKKRSVADPFVISLADVKQQIIVSYESGGTKAKPKIPFVCRELGIRCINFTEFITEQGWIF